MVYRVLFAGSVLRYGADLLREWSGSKHADHEVDDYVDKLSLDLR